MYYVVYNLAMAKLIYLYRLVKVLVKLWLDQAVSLPKMTSVLILLAANV